MLLCKYAGIDLTFASVPIIQPYSVHTQVRTYAQGIISAFVAQAMRMFVSSNEFLVLASSEAPQCESFSNIAHAHFQDTVRWLAEKQGMG